MIWTWGKLSAGCPWHIVARDLDRATMLPNIFGEYERFIFGCIRHESWGKSMASREAKRKWPDAKPCKIRTRKLAEAIGVHGSRLRGAVSSLVRSRILIKVKAGYLINKNANEWIFPPGHKRAGQPRLTPGQIEYCTEGIRLKSVADSECDESDSATTNDSHDDPSCTSRRTKDDRINDRRVHPSVQKCTPTRTKQVCPAVPPQTPYSRSAGAELREKENSSIVVVTEAMEGNGKHSPSTTTTPLSQSEIPTEAKAKAIALFGPAVESKIEHLITAESVPAAWLVPAIERCEAKRAKDGSVGWAYLRRLMISYRDEGGPPVIALKPKPAEPVYSRADLASSPILKNLKATWEN
jgi:hypothetical protein